MGRRSDWRIIFICTSSFLKHAVGLLCWVMVLGYGAGLWCWVMLGYCAGLWCWVMVLGYGAGLWCWVIVLGYGAGLWCWVMVLLWCWVMGRYGPRALLEELSWLCLNPLHFWALKSCDENSKEGHVIDPQAGPVMNGVHDVPPFNTF